MSDAAPLRAEALSLAYDDRLVVSDLDVAVPDRRITVIVGANACRPRLPPETTRP